jgi:hypothetical protein
MRRCWTGATGDTDPSAGARGCIDPGELLSTVDSCGSPPRHPPAETVDEWDDHDPQADRVVYLPHVATFRLVRALPSPRRWSATISAFR